MEVQQAMELQATPTFAKGVVDLQTLESMQELRFYSVQAPPPQFDLPMAPIGSGATQA